MPTLSRRALSALFAIVLVGCGSGDESHESTSGPSGASPSGEGAQLRFKNVTGQAWLSHIAVGKTGVTSFSYKIVLGGIPTSIKFDLSELADGAATDYQAVSASTYADANVLHQWSYNYNKGSGGNYIGASESKQEYSRLGLDLALAANKKYTVELGASSAAIVEDP